jgi:intraflagellar transport protein 140
MSIFSEIKLQKSEEEEPYMIAISNTKATPFLAMIVPKKVIFFDENGDRMEFFVEKNMNPTFLDWHPGLPIVCIGWSSGALTLVNLQTLSSRDESNVHQGAVTKIKFNQTGQRMVSVDADGNIAIWKDLNCLSVYEKGCALTCLSNAELIIERPNRPTKHMSLFFVGGQQGHVFYTDESRCEELCKLNGAILSLMFYKKSQSIVLITSTLIFLQFRISTNQKSTPDKKVKLSLSASAEKIESEWIDPSSFVISSGEGIIRLWNVETDSNYNLSLADAQKDQGGITILTGKILTSKFDKRT